MSFLSFKSWISLRRQVHAQVCLLTRLRSKKSCQRVILATTHLKARNGALLSTLRNEQGKDLLSFLSEEALQQDPSSDEPPPPVVLTGDFNAEPDEPVYATITGDENLR